jgi:hypothetical protein
LKRRLAGAAFISEALESCRYDVIDVFCRHPSATRRTELHVEMNRVMRDRYLSGLLAAATLPLLLAGCYAPHVVDSQDTRYCESLGFRPGSDPNYKCASDREAERERGGPVPPLEPPPPPKPMISAEPPPDHVGGVSQITPRSIPPGATRVINFSISVNSDCVAVGVPKVRIGMQPAHGTLKLIQITDFARLSQIGAPVSCTDNRVAGAALLYTPAKYYEGEDLVEIEITTPAGRTYFQVPITVEEPSDDDE